MPGLSGENRFPEILEEAAIVLAGLDQARIPADRFLAAVTSHLAEHGIYILDGPIAVSDDNAFSAVFDGINQTNPLLLRPFAVGTSWTAPITR